MTPSDVITEVRQLIQDTRVTYRYSDIVLLGFINQIIKRMVVIRPDLFSVVADISTTANVVLQSTPTDSLRLVEIFQVKNGDAVTEVSRDTLDQTYPGWVNEPSGFPVNFMRHVRNPNKFFVYPRPSSGVVLVGEYVQIPANYILSDTIGLPNAYLPAIVDGTIYLAESVDNEHVNSGRAKMYQESFMRNLDVGLQARVITDTEQGGLEPKQVI